MRLVIVESPFAGKDHDETEYNIEYVRACLHDCLMRGEAPFASHGLYTLPGVLDDKIPEQRELGINAGLAWKKIANATVVYTDLGISKGMQLGINAVSLAVSLGIDHTIEYRKLGGKWAEPRNTIDDRTTAYWHGCWLDSGHHLWNRSGRSVHDVMPFSEDQLDGNYAPVRTSHRDVITCVLINRDARHRSEELPQGQFVRHVVEGWTIIAWWDRTQGDTRSGCNSCYIVKGEHTTSQMLKWFPVHFPKQAERLAKTNIKLVEVFLATDKTKTPGA